MSGKPVIAVFGATGQQGGAVVRELLAEGKWAVRALTRNTTSEKAKALKAQGAEVQQVDLDDVESVKKALAGARAAFLVTDFWSHMDAAKDEKQGRDAVDAAKAAGVKHFLYSGLENVMALKGYAVPHFDAKGKVEEYLAKSSLPYTILRLPFYFENFLNFLKPERIDLESFTVGIPMGSVPMDGMSVAELGKVVKAVLASPDQFLGKTLGLSADRLTTEQYAEALQQQLTPLKFIDPKLRWEEFANLGFPGAGDMGAMFRFYQEGPIVRDVTATRALAPDLSTFAQFVAKHKQDFLRALEALPPPAQRPQ